MAQESKARQVELEEEKAKQEEAAAQRAAEQAEAAELNRQRWIRLGEEFVRLGITTEKAARMWVECPEDEQVKALSRLLSGQTPETICFDLDLGWELCDCFLVADFADAGVSLDYVLTGIKAGEEWHTGWPEINGYYFCIKSGARTAGMYWWQDDHWEGPEAKYAVNISVALWTPAPSIPEWAQWEREEV